MKTSPIVPEPGIAFTLYYEELPTIKPVKRFSK